MFKISRTHAICLTGTASLALFGTAQGEVLAGYDFTGDTMNATTVGSNVTTSTLTPPTGIPNNRFSGAIDGKSVFVFGVETSNALDPAFYWEFTLTADSGFELDLDEISLVLGASDSTQDAVGFNASLNLRSSIDGFSSNLSFEQGPSDTATVLSLKTTTATPTNFSTFTIDLSGAAYQDLSAVTFRLYPSADLNTDGAGVVRLDDVNVSGVSNVVPEPASLALFSLAGSCLLVRRKRA